MMEGYDHKAIGRIRTMAEAGAEVRKDFSRKNEKYLPNWLIATWYFSLILSIVFFAWVLITIYNYITNG